MPSTLLSLAVVVLLTLGALAFVMTAGRPLIESARSSSDFTDAELALLALDNRLREVAREGNGSARLLPFTVPQRLDISGAEDAAVFRSNGPLPFVEFNRRIRKGFLLFIGGSDVNCYAADVTGDNRTDLVLENAFVQFAFNLTPATSPLTSLDTGRLLIRMVQKTTGTVVTVVNSSFVIDDDPSTGYGTGYSELVRTGTSLPFCTVHAAINTTNVSYDAYFRLYAGADYLVTDVRNIR